MCFLSRIGAAGRSCRVLRQDRQPHNRGRALADLGFIGDAPFHRHEGGPHDPESQTGPLTAWFGGKKWLKDLGAMFGGNPRAIILNTNFNPFSPLARGRMACRNECGRHRKRPTPVRRHHRLHRVQCQIEKRFLQLPGITQDRRKVRCQRDRHLDMVFR